MATVGFLIQLCVVYWVPVLRRPDPAWWNGEMLYYALNHDQIATSLGVWLRQWSFPLPWLSLGVIWWEVIGPLLVWVPVFPQLCRLIAVIGFSLLHLGIGLFMSIGIFPIVCIVAWLAVLPGGFWDAVQRRQSVTSIGEWLHSKSWLSARLRSMPTAWRPRAVNLQPSMWTNLAAGFFVCFILAWNLQQLTPKRIWLPSQLNVVSYVFGLRQNWNMFTPGPPRDDGWYVIAAKLQDGQQVNLLTDGGPVSFEKPDLVIQSLPNHRWQRYFENLKAAPDNMLWNFFTRYVTWRWHQSHGPQEQIRQLDIYYVQEETLPDGVAPPEKRLLWTYKSQPAAKPGPPQGAQRARQ